MPINVINNSLNITIYNSNLAQALANTSTSAAQQQHNTSASGNNMELGSVMHPPQQHIVTTTKNKGVKDNQNRFGPPYQEKKGCLQLREDRAQGNNGNKLDKKVAHSLEVKAVAV